MESQKPKKQEMTWYVYITNCDCSSDWIARRSKGRWSFGPRCRGCGRIMGPMQWTDVGKIKARTEGEAIETIRKNRIKNIQT
nr:hypothetical protein 31 [Candidatus Omnitrophota bacterium]